MRAQEFLPEEIAVGSVLDLTKNWGNYEYLHGPVEAITPNGKLKIKIVRADPQPGKKVKLYYGDQVVLDKNFVRRAPVLSEEQLDEILTFKGSPCTVDCSGHRAGYEWYKRKQKVPNSWSQSFNNGANIAAAGK